MPVFQIRHMPRILFVGEHDWAGLCYRIAAAINDVTAEVTARVYTTHKSRFASDNLTYAQMLERAATANWIISSGDGDYTTFMEAVKHKNELAHVAVTHAGTAFRQWPDIFAKLDKDVGAKLRFIGADSLYLAENDPTIRPYWGTCGLTVWKSPKPTKTEGPLRVTHSPAHEGRRGIKGTGLILKVFDRLRPTGLFDFDLIENIAPDEALMRRKTAHVHVDQMNIDVGGFGQSAVEAMGAGCAVLANMRFVRPDLVSRWLCQPQAPPVIDVRTEADLYDWLTLLAREHDVATKHRQAAWTWAQENASDNIVGRRWLWWLKEAAGLPIGGGPTVKPLLKPED